MVLKACVHEWLSGGVSPCQGEGRGLERFEVLAPLRSSQAKLKFYLSCIKDCLRFLYDSEECIAFKKMISFI